MSRPWGVPSRCGGSRAAAADADLAVVALESGIGLVPQLREALVKHRKANRFALHNPSLRVSGEGGEKGADDPVIVYARPITDTCKEVVDGMVRRTVPRDGLVDAQGPWVFDRAALEAVIDAVTDEAKIGNIVELCLRAQLPIRVRLD